MTKYYNIINSNKMYNKARLFHLLYFAGGSDGTASKYVSSTMQFCIGVLRVSVFSALYYCVSIYHSS